MRADDMAVNGLELKLYCSHCNERLNFGTYKEEWLSFAVLPCKKCNAKHANLVNALKTAINPESL